MRGEATSKYHRSWPPVPAKARPGEAVASRQATADSAPEGRPTRAFPGPSASGVASAVDRAATPRVAPTDLRAVLRARGMRVTPQRLAVHGALHSIGRHSTAEEVLERVHGNVPGVSLPTVYAALELLADLGLAARVQAGRAVRYDPRTEAHHHLVCTSCGAVADLDADVELGPALERARALGAQASGAEVVVRGLCAACSATAH
jgi:Fe2+ or Zn2+ uptake regulation protein